MKNMGIQIKRSEHEMQKAIFAWARCYEKQVDGLELMFAIPNGGHRRKSTAARLKAEGVKPGVSDICLPVARGGYHGLFAECKVGKNRLRKNQADFLESMGRQGYFTAVWWTFDQAKSNIVNYLSGAIRRGGK